MQSATSTEDGTALNKELTDLDELVGSFYSRLSAMSNSGSKQGLALNMLATIQTKIREIRDKTVPEST
ncbi:MAG: hypothetical protein JWP44_5086 [Mucilaginibacter sp.]|nr:hypothetical protein [Mucilaginibacter sp.]